VSACIYFQDAVAPGCPAVASDGQRFAALQRRVPQRGVLGASAAPSLLSRWFPGFWQVGHAHKQEPWAEPVPSCHVWHLVMAAESETSCQQHLR